MHLRLVGVVSWRRQRSGDTSRSAESRRFLKPRPETKLAAAADREAAKGATKVRSDLIHLPRKKIERETNRRHPTKIPLITDEEAAIKRQLKSDWQDTYLESH